MALTVIHPNSLCFAGNPVVVKATTTQTTAGTNKTFLRIIITASFRTTSFSDIQPYTTEMSVPVEDAGTAVFNLSDSAQTLIRRIHAEMDMNSADDSPSGHGWMKPVSIICTYSLREVWLFENNEHQGDVSSEYTIRIVPGFLTDYEMLSMDSIDLGSLITQKPMTRKPDMGIVYNGEEIILPVVSEQSNTPTFKGTVNGTQVFSSSVSGYLSDKALDYQWSKVSYGSDGDLVVDSGYLGSRSGYFRANTEGVFFLRFINGFGAIENISVRCKDKLSYEIGEGKIHSLVQQATTRPTDRRYATKGQPVGLYELSSGYIPKRWAEWYVQELLTSTKVWILIGSKWVPATIESDDNCVIYDRAKSGMPHVDFRVRLSIDGVTGCTW